ncbi:MAG: hypothetical protein JSV09_11765, partial [Thermoplasmata archaeon]
MVDNTKRIIAVIILLMISFLLDPAGVGRISMAVDVDDGTLSDWVNVTVAFNDPLGDSPIDMTDLVFVAFDFDDTWLYVRWDIDNDGTKPAVLYDMGINITASGITWDIFVAAQIERISGTPVLTNISIRDSADAHIWNASDDGNLTEDGTLYFDPPPGGTPGTISVEARFPLSYITSSTGLIFSQFRSHSSIQVTSNVKDFVPDSGYIILSVDDNPPELSNLTDTPDPQGSGGNVNITVDVTDDYNVESVWVNITYPNSSWINASMLPGSGDGWFYNTSYIDLGIYSYTVWANDSSDNWNSTGPGTFNITGDGVLPEFSNLLDFPDPQNPGGNVNITVDVTDNMGVGLVWVNITFPNGTWNNVSMVKGSGDNWYYNDSYTDPGTYSYTVWANDTSDNYNSSGPETFTIQDIEGPELQNVNDAPDPQENDGFVNITVDATDDIAVDEVWINITYPNGSWVNVGMGKGMGNEWFYNDTYSDLGVHSYTIWANDTSNNWNFTGPETFTIQDTDSPELQNVNDAPDPQENGDYVNITLDVTDDIAVDEVWINITYPDSKWTNITIDKGPADQWYYNATYSDLGVHSYTIWANDTSNNWNSTSPGTFTIKDTDAPQFQNVNDAPDPQENDGYVNITVDVTDDVTVDEVWINITYPNGSWMNVSLGKGTGDEWFYNNTYPDLGSHSYTIWANDTSNNWNSTSPGTFTIQDTDGPEFYNLLDSPDPQSMGGYVNISVNVTDDLGVDEVWVNITFPNGSWINTSMQDDIGDGWFYNDTFNDIGTYSYTVWANDTNNNWNRSASGTFEIKGDVIPPELWNLNDFPDPQKPGEFVNITVDVTDETALDEVWVNVTYPDASWVNVSMNPGSGTEWFYNTTYFDSGIYFYFVWANDTSNNMNSTGPGTFTIQDTDGPEFGNLDDTPDPQENDGYVNITCDVMDDVAVDDVWVNITFPDGSWTNVSMLKGNGDGWYYNTSYAELGTYSYTVWANDTSNNWNFTGPGTFFIQDTDGPLLSNLNDIPDPQENGGYVNISVDVIDDMAVDEIWLNITYPNGTWINTRMEKGAGDTWFYNMTYDALGDYSYIIWANDTSGNWNSTITEIFTIIDTDGPVLSNPNDTPDPQENGGNVNITVDVADDVAVDEVWINITSPNGSWINVTMNPGLGDEWFFDTPFTELGIYQYIIWANDTSSNWNKTGANTFTIQDVDGPVFLIVNDFPDPQEVDGFVNITTDIWDDVAVDEVWINIIYPNGSWINVSMFQGLGDEWFYEANYTDLGTYFYTIFANDTSNNWNATGPRTFDIKIDIIPPLLLNASDFPDPQITGGYVNITVEAVDDTALGVVLLNITNPGGNSINVSMILGLGNKWYYNTTYSIPGLYSYIIWANDTSDNRNATAPGTFVIVDIQAPEFNNIQDIPDPQVVTGFVNISVDVTDDVAVSVVWVNITYPDGSWANITMIKGSGDSWYYQASYVDLGVYTYVIWANDTSDNWNSTSSKAFTILDLEKPQILTTNDSPDPQENGGLVNITSEIIDNVGVQDVWVNIIYPDSSWINVSMIGGSGNTWFCNNPYPELGIHSYTVWVKDTSDNWNSSGPGTFFIQDTDGPYLDNLNCTPNIQSIGGSVNISVDATDDIGVGSVWVNITYPDGSWQNNTMDKGPLDKWYLDLIYPNPGIYTYIIYASDTSDNWNSTIPETFEISIYDTPPILWDLNASPSLRVFGGFVNISVKVMDDFGVEEVFLNLTYPNGNWINESMMPGTGYIWFYIDTYSNLGIYSYVVWARDTGDNWNTTNPGTFTILDITPPWFENIMDTPDPQENREYVNISVNVFDDVGVGGVW